MNIYMGKLDLSCYHCYAKNRIEIGTAYHNTMSWYRCHSCKKVSSVMLEQASLDQADKDRGGMTVQLGEEIPV